MHANRSLFVIVAVSFVLSSLPITGLCADAAPKVGGVVSGSIVLPEIGKYAKGAPIYVFIKSFQKGVKGNPPLYVEIPSADIKDNKAFFKFTDVAPGTVFGKVIWDTYPPPLDETAFKKKTSFPATEPGDYQKNLNLGKLVPGGSLTGNTVEGLTESLGRAGSSATEYRLSNIRLGKDKNDQTSLLVTLTNPSKERVDYLNLLVTVNDVPFSKAAGGWGLIKPEDSTDWALELSKIKRMTSIFSRGKTAGGTKLNVVVDR